MNISANKVHRHCESQLILTVTMCWNGVWPALYTTRD